MDSMYKHQGRIVDFNLRRLFTEGQLGAGTFAGMGSGKTRSFLECILLLNNMNEVDRTLVVAPLLVGHEVWPSEIKKWNYNFKHSFVNGETPRLNGQDLVICSPDSLHHILPVAHRFGLMIVDESDRFKNWTAKRTKNLRKLLPLIPKRVIATGTPMPNGISDLMPQIYAVDDGATLGKNITAFRNKYMVKGGWQGRQFVAKKDSEESIMQAISPLVLRIPPSEYDHKMPELTTVDLKVTMSGEALVAQRTLKKQLLIQLAEDKLLIAPNAASAYMKLRQLASGFVYHESSVESFGNQKLQAVRELVEQMGGEQVVVFHNFKEDRARLLQEFGVANVAVLGEGKDLNTWLDGKKQILTCQELSGSHGLNLQSCRYIMFYNISDSAGRHEQALARVHRPGGQHRHVFCYRLVSSESVDEIILQRVLNKISNQQEFLNALTNWAQGI